MSSFTDDIRARGMTPGSRTLELRVVPAGARLGRVLHVSPSEPVVVATRLRLADRETMAIETLHVRESLIPGLTEGDLENGSFYELLRGPLRHRIVGGAADDRAHGDERGGVGGARRPAALAGVPVRAPRRARESGEIVEFVSSIYRGDRYRLVTELSVRPTPRRSGIPIALYDDGLGG